MSDFVVFLILAIGITIWLGVKFPLLGAVVLVIGIIVAIAFLSVK